MVRRRPTESSCTFDAQIVKPRRGTEMEIDRKRGSERKKNFWQKKKRNKTSYDRQTDIYRHKRLRIIRYNTLIICTLDR